MTRVTTVPRARIIVALVEGDSIRATARMLDVSKATVVTKLLVDLGPICAAYHDAQVRSIAAERVHCDEMWAFCSSKQKNVSPEQEGVFGYGDVWTWTALCADSTLAISWLVGLRNGACATAFMVDVAGRLAVRPQLTTDGHRPYLDAIEAAFGAEVDDAPLIKLVGPDQGNEKRDSPAQCIGIEKRVIQGSPTRRTSARPTSSGRTSRCG